MICNCNQVTEHEIVDAVKNKGAVNVQDIMDITSAGTACGSCIDDIEEIVKRERK
ncbi:MAG: (2Fe-2S)-binding protein [Bacteroidetes bacterium 4572_112]|nr:MAG: (2Fe-2S)-binding protein [Bacteroidetes bacterium 4572_112]